MGKCTKNLSGGFYGPGLKTAILLPLVFHWLDLSKAMLSCKGGRGNEVPEPREKKCRSPSNPFRQLIFAFPLIPLIEHAYCLPRETAPNPIYQLLQSSKARFSGGYASSLTGLNAAPLGLTRMTAKKQTKTKTKLP